MSSKSQPLAAKGDRYFYSNRCPESNFYPHPFKYNDRILPTSEHHFMVEKARLMGDEEAVEKICKAKTPAEAKRLGRKIKLNVPLWNANSMQIMSSIVLAKFQSSKKLRAHLLKFEGHFYEASPKDTLWGIGISVKDAEAGKPHHPNAQNRLGKILDAVRDRLAKEE